MEKAAGKNCRDTPAPIAQLPLSAPKSKALLDEAKGEGVRLRAAFVRLNMPFSGALIYIFASAAKCGHMPQK